MEIWRWILVVMLFGCVTAEQRRVKRFKVGIKSNLTFDFQLTPKEPECGVPSSNTHSRIVGGVPSVLGAWPWIAVLMFTMNDDLNDRYFGGGGTLISLNHVITAAHCVEKTFPKILSVVRLGDLDLNTTVDDGAAPVEIPVMGFTTHPNYKHETAQVYPHHDISIIKLKHPAVLTNFIKPICLPTLPELRTDNFERKSPFVIGWGQTSSKGSRSSTLLEAQVTVVEHEICKSSYEKMNVHVTRGQICAGGDSKDSCTGDSGGPLMLPQSGKYYIIGIVSLGLGCADVDYPGLYTKVPDYVDWILDNTRQQKNSK
ncbi:hypothetical protein GE061_009805 [Apolygus lucorum]|uniref:limulus clotting factor C n=1 Tax=Apolygus lucorum TaxID=248454 RepID=A0A6A4K867_APOLU|nr:hypothetical protein GE061_009805 [Apolygus lucorum]